MDKITIEIEEKELHFCYSFYSDIIFDKNYNIELFENEFDILKLLLKI